MVDKYFYKREKVANLLFDLEKVFDRFGRDIAIY